MSKAKPTLTPDLFRLLILLVVGIIASCGVAMVGLTIWGVAMEEMRWARFVPLVEAFRTAFTIAVGALLGLLGGKAVLVPDR